MEEIIAQLRTMDAKKRQLLLMMLEKQGIDLSHVILPQERTNDVFPMSYTQQRFWFLDQLETGNPAYNESLSIELIGQVDGERLEQSFELLIARHETLRTSFTMQDGVPVQKIAPASALTLVAEDLRECTGDGWEATVAEIAKEEASRPFDLHTAPLFRVRMLQVADDRHVLVLTLHHIICDAWSNGILVSELLQAYQALDMGQKVTWQPLDVQYADYAVWQREWMSGKRLEEQLAYWKTQLQGAPPLLDVPSDRPRPVNPSFRGAVYADVFETALCTRVQEVAVREGATPFMVLLAAFQALLHRYTGQEDLVVGTPIAGRNRAELEGLIGLFLNNVVLRTSCRAQETFRELLARVRETTLGAYAHQDLPFEKLVEELNPERDFSYSPLFQVMFTYLNTPFPEASAGSLRANVKKRDSGWVKYDLVLNVREIEQELHIDLEYSTDLFDEATVVRMVGHLRTLLSGALANLDQSIGELPLLTEAEHQQMLVAWNATRVPVPTNACLHHLIEEQARKTPDAVAVVYKEQSLTYGELDARANQLARHLQLLGIGPDHMVGIMVERSLDMMVGLLGILKAGGAYVPLDPHYPKERLRYIAEDSGLTVLITQHAHRKQLEGQVPHVVCLDREWSAIAANSAEPLVSGVTADHLAYVIYTSGSTGRPKGVLVNHHNVVNFCSGMDERVGATERDALLAVTSISFDISINELFWTLTKGAKVVLLPEQGKQTGITAPAQASTKDMKFGLFYFDGNGGNEHGDKYRLLIEGAKFADQHGFSAIWTPERHFHAFGGLYPNPSVTSAALAMVTEHVELRSGSVVLPLHHPLRIAEEWSVVDNLSQGRVALSVASGWHEDDFVLAEGAFADRVETMFAGIETLRQLWRGETVRVQNGMGREVEVTTLPRPVQHELPIWITTAGSPAMFERAGAMGANVLTHLLGQSLEELADKIALYRKALAEHGHDPQQGRVALMIHTFVGEDLDEVRETVRQPFTDYLRSSIGLINKAKSFYAASRSDVIHEDDQEALLEYAFERYFETSALFGTPDTCLEEVEQLRAIGVDELACLIDFGMEESQVLAGLELLNTLRERCAEETVPWPEQVAPHRITMMQSTPSFMRMLLSDEHAVNALSSLHTVMLGGEGLPVPLAQQVLDTWEVRLLNMYGPTETTIWSSTHTVERDGERMTIGRPIANTEFYILDAHLQPVPIGVTGDLYIGGSGVTRGYWNRPELTAERFLPHPFDSESNKRLYKTGDKAAYLPTGEVRLLGRDDQQVKMRGFRIELGEIEAALLQLPGVREAAVIVHGDTGAERRLNAYVVAEQEQRLTVEALRQGLQSQLPEHFLPSAFVLLDQLPLTPNGKVDRNALAARSDEMRPDNEFVAPRTEYEQQMADIWCELLGREQVGVQDNFFALGGHSMLVTLLIQRIREQFQVDIPLRSFFRKPTIERLVEELVELELSGADDELLLALLAEMEDV